MTSYTDYDIDAALDPIARHRGHRSEDDWDAIWSNADRNRDPLRGVKPALALIAAGVALILVRAGWRRMESTPMRVVPSAVDIHVRMPPPR